jgi:Mg2+/Co2+ transporter CorC
VATTSGWVTQKLGGFPKAGDTLTLGPYALRVDRTDGMKVARLTLTRQPDPPKPAD